jgi:mannose/fructose/N-acetylgalactosamine-specific phosphotransferase system component IIC
MSLQEFLLIAAWAGLAAMDETAAFQTMLHQPLVSCTVTAAILGQPEAGLWVGVPLQAVWSGLLPLGAASYPDVPVGAVAAGAAAALCARGPAGLAAGVLLGLAAGLCAGGFFPGTTRALRRANDRLCSAADRAAERADASRIALLNLAGAAAMFGRGAVLAAGVSLALVPVVRAIEGVRGLPPGGRDIDPPVGPVLAVGLGVLAATFAAGVRRRYLAFAVSAAVAFLIRWGVR